MSYYEVEIEGKYNLEKISGQIADEEVGASEFKSSRVSGTATRVTNIVTFYELSPGTIPKPITLVKQGGSQPSGTKQVWAGVMVVEGNLTSVVAYREE
ncbi:MAG: hypothetical protein ACOZF2_05690 [Thermodesulfobacteriota bacterium]